MVLQISIVVVILIVGFIESLFYAGFSSKVATQEKAFGITGFKFTQCFEAFTKGNHLTQYITEQEWAKYKWFKRLRVGLSICFIISIILV
jgi:hypothetical protein